ncbi:MAG: DUF362 domain-containing protein [Nitrospinae bacterium]|nr:DUF362 domain-containing protein [Nitrospinota bacterium]
MENRRAFLKRARNAGLTAAGFGLWGYWYYNPTQPVREIKEKIYSLKPFTIETSNILPEMVIVHGKEPQKNVKAAVDKLGGIARFIKPGDRVLIKPNVGWDRMPEQAANSNPFVVAEVVRLCREAKAGEIIVTDVSLNDVIRCFKRSGIAEEAQNAGAKIIYPSSNDFLQVDLKGSLLKVWPVYEEFIKADKLINVPVVKHHSLCKATLSMKNWYGAIGGKRNRLHQDIHTSVVDLARAFKPTLTVMDASRILMQGGPTGGNLNDVKTTNMIIAGTDEVAIDAYSSTLLGYKHDEIEFIRMAKENNLGTYNLNEVRTDEITLS